MLVIVDKTGVSPTALPENEPIEHLQNAEPIFSHTLILMRSKYWKGTVREGFETSVYLRSRLISSQVHSATLQEKNRSFYDVDGAKLK